MENPIQQFWKIRLADLKTSLESNNFEVYLAENREQAANIVMKEIIPGTRPQRISWGGSKTFLETGLYDQLQASQQLEIIDTYDKNLTPEASYERRRQSLLVDLFFMGTNAVTESGQLVNLDMIGNRVGALTFGPRHVVVMVGRNKLVQGIDEAMNRIKDYAADRKSVV